MRSSEKLYMLNLQEQPGNTCMTVGHTMREHGVCQDCNSGVRKRGDGEEGGSGEVWDYRDKWGSDSEWHSETVLS